MGIYKNARKSIADFIGCDVRSLTNILYKKGLENYYIEFEIPKKSGGVRKISAPSKKSSLKMIQKKLSDKLYNMYYRTDVRRKVSHGYEKGKSIITNAQCHRNKRYVLNVDIKDFFDSFHFGRVRGFFSKNKIFNFTEKEATIIAQLVCYKGALPQGAPTSPIVTNLLFNIVDMRIVKLARKYKLTYTRYADDMSFSTNSKEFPDKINNFIEELKRILNRSGFSFNEKKTRMDCYSLRQCVTGVTVNKKLNPSKEFIKNTRAMAHNLFVNNEISFPSEDKELSRKSKLRKLSGRFSFINQFDKLNDESKNNKKIFRLNSREKQYQQFLFHTNFFSPDKPVIVTEGKTDKKHLKAALKKMYLNYPNLIFKNDKNEFEFKVKFLKRTPTLSRFLDISTDGADTMSNIWNMYTGGGQYPNLFKKLKQKRNKALSNNPVVLIFDNEQVPDKPLKKFLNKCQQDMNANVSSINLIQNLYLQTIPLKHGYKEMEIEDLYLEEEINRLQIGGKSFSRHSTGGDVFGKEILADYVYNNYKQFNFDGFKPLLDELNKLVTNKIEY